MLYSYGLVLAAVAAAARNGNLSVTPAVAPTAKTGENATTTEVGTTVFTTYCPEPTTFSHGGSQITVSEATTLTLTECDCTKSKKPEEASEAPSAPVVPTAAPKANTSAPANVSAPATVTTEGTTLFTTYCPGPTTFSHGGSQVTVSEATTLTLTDCGCTKSKEAETSPAGVTSKGAVPAPAASGNGTVPGNGTTPANGSSPTDTAPPTSNKASSAAVGVAALIAGALALLA